TQIKDTTDHLVLKVFIDNYPTNRNRQAAEDRMKMIQDWTSVKAKNTAEDLRAYRERYKNSPFDAEARRQLDENAKAEEAARIAEADLKKKKGTDDGKKKTTTPVTGTRAGKDGLTYIGLAGGTYQMGCAPGDAKCDKKLETPRPVTVNAFYIGKTEVP